jgi:16S rRNA (cytidine1402-2'-O)-methyltransferase
MESESENPACLILLPSFMGHPDPALLSAEEIRILPALRSFAVEDIRSARRFLRAAGFKAMFDECVFFEYDKHSGQWPLKEVLAHLIKGAQLGLLSEAGCPAIADPGRELVAAAHQAGIRVKPLSGPNSILLTLMGSGFNGQNFRFHGYLPVKTEERRKAIKHFAERVSVSDETHLFIETPYRNAALFADLMSNLPAHQKLCIGAGLTTPDEFVLSLTVADWKKRNPFTEKIPAVFAIGK